MTATLRPATVEDAAELAALAERTFLATYPFPEFAEVAQRHVAEVLSPAAVRRELSSDHEWYTVAEQDGALVGFAKVMVDTPPPEVAARARRPIYLHRLYLDKSAQGTGLGARMLLHCEQRAKAHGHDGMYLGVWDVNQRAHAFYLRHGYEQLGTIPWVSGDHTAEDLLMYKALG